MVAKSIVLVSMKLSTYAKRNSPNMSGKQCRFVKFCNSCFVWAKVIGVRWIEPFHPCFFQLIWSHAWSFKFELLSIFERSPPHFVNQLTSRNDAKSHHKSQCKETQGFHVSFRADLLRESQEETSKLRKVNWTGCGCKRTRMNFLALTLVDW